MPRGNPTSRQPSRPRKRRRWITPSDIIFFAFAVLTYFHEFWQGDGDPTLLGLFAVFFFLGLIPAFRADQSGGMGLGDAQRVLIKLLGGEPPEGGEKK